jgi:hypothetical protein
MEDKTFILYIGCGKTRTTITLNLKSDVDYWWESKIKAMKISPDTISGFRVGPGLVIELYSDAYMSTLREVIRNKTTKEGMMYDIGCYEDHPVWRGVIRSFRVWDYNKFQKENGIIQCDSDKECKMNEYCLCPNGERRAEWCPNVKRRCLSKYLMLHNKRRGFRPSNRINMKCLIDKINKAGDRYNSFNTIMEFGKDCSGANIDEIEGFGPKVYGIDLKLVLVVIMLIIIIFGNIKN